MNSKIISILCVDFVNKTLVHAEHSDESGEFTDEQLDIIDEVVFEIEEIFSEAAQ